MTMEFNFILSNNSSNGFFTGSDSDESTLLTAGTLGSQSASILSTDGDGECIDAFGGKDIFGTCDFSNVDTESFVAFDSSETAGSMAFNSASETMGSIACGSAETAGSVACSSGSSDGGFSGGGFSSFC